MKYLLIVLTFLSANAFAWESDSDKKETYKSRYGNEYEYDLSKPVDQIKYEVDERAKMRDSLDVDPMREIERDLGEYGGGKVNKKRY